MKKMFFLFLMLWLVSCTSTSFKRNNFPVGGELPQYLSIVTAQNRYLGLEPCGCSMGPLGGAIREWNLTQSWRRIMDRPLLYLSSGTTFVVLPKQYKKQHKEYYAKKAEYFVEALNELGVTAISPTLEDFSLGIKTIQHLEKKAAFSFVSANLYQKSTNKLIFRPYIELEYGPHSILITGISSKAKKVYDPDSDIIVRSPEQSLKELFKGLKPRKRLIIVINSLKEKQAQALRKAVPEIQILLGGGEKEQTMVAYQYGANQLYFNPVSQGRQLGRIDIRLAKELKGFYNENEAPKFSQLKTDWEYQLSAAKKKLKNKKLSKSQKKKIKKNIKGLENRLAQVKALPLELKVGLSTYWTKTEYLNTQYAKPDNKMTELIKRYNQAIHSISMNHK